MNALEVLKVRGFVQQCTEGVEALLEKPAVFYAGFDPSGDSIHVGHLVPVMAMAHLQRAGHRPIAVVGGGTGMVGDPSGKDEARQLLSQERIESHKAALKKQLGHFLDFSEGAGQMVDNAEWLLALNYVEFLREIGRHFSVNTMLSKASVKLRLERGLSFLEFNYQVLQAYDFLELYKRHGCLLQIGGDDQWGNITAGIDLIRRVEGAESHGLTVPLITTASGAKMGKTVAGAVWLDPNKLSPYDYYQFWVNVDDRDVGRFLRLFTFLDLGEIQRLEQLEGAQIREAKQVLAREATRIVHGSEAAQEAEQGAQAAFAGGGDAQAMPHHGASLPIPLVHLLADAGLCDSRSDARRQIQGGAIKVGGERVEDKDFVLDAARLNEEGAVVVSRGKKRHVRVTQA
jgi:tyrosyl-tRNA synthetase